MYKQLLFAATLIGSLSLVAFKWAHHAPLPALKYISRSEAMKNKFTMQCSPNWTLLNSDSLANGITILSGWGNYRWDINSKSDSARLYFQQGINMYYSFHIIEAMASFKKAARFDENNAMIWWAQALAYGPNINDYASNIPADAYTAAQKAMALSPANGPKEKGLIQAMAVRYSADTAAGRSMLNQQYADKMEKAYEQFPHDADIGALYADALMLQHPWQYWKHDGEAQPWTGRILEVLEKTLQQSPLHPGANHYYIHSVEASGNPQRALASADRLAKLMPSVSHMVHMPSHIYIRSGHYSEGMKVNELGVKGYQDYLSVYPEVVNNAALYLIHNLHMQAACALMGAGYEYSTKSANACRASFDSSFLSLPSPFGDFIQYVYMTPVLTDVRFGKWKAILGAAALPGSYAYANVLSHWARGMAKAKTNDLEGAKEELKYVQAKKDEPGMLVVMEPFNAPVDAARVAEKILEGVIAEQENDLAGAIYSFTQAVKNEDGMIYNEPKDWLLPAREFLGAALLKNGNFAKAESVFKEDLKENPANHWALKGLYQSLQTQKKVTAANKIKKQLDKTMTEGDLKNMPVVF